jgi:UDP-galactopyranose mutase
MVAHNFNLTDEETGWLRMSEWRQFDPHSELQARQTSIHSETPASKQKQKQANKKA